ncbi:MAG: EamA family transporter [Candidatus Scatosoma sp.]
MSYLYLIISVFGSASSSVIGEYYNVKNKEKKDSTPIYSLILFITLFCFWTVLFLFDGSVSLAVIPYSLCFATGFVFCNVGLVQALKTGPVFLTSFIIQLSLIAVTLWGFFFWNAKFTPSVGIGLVLVVISLWLCLYTKKDEKNKVSFKWIFWVSLTFLGNGACSIVQRTQQTAFDGKFGSFMMASAMLISVLFGVLYYLKSDKSDSKVILKSSVPYPVLAGIFNAVMNLCVMALATSALSPSIIYPVLAVGGLAVTTLFSTLVFKEKIFWRQWIGIGVGAVALALLSV